mmetsp:Transcript_47883/g.96435  ORF Transcript_47883/g.96435 Transcript_47883/m.96435 type:complete len:306 (+) Transcript_47883:291-1208(+)
MQVVEVRGVAVTRQSPQKHHPLRSTTTPSNSSSGGGSRWVALRPCPTIVATAVITAAIITITAATAVVATVVATVVVAAAVAVATVVVAVAVVLLLALEWKHHGRLGVKHAISVQYQAAVPDPKPGQQLKHAKLQHLLNVPPYARTGRVGVCAAGTQMRRDDVSAEFRQLRALVHPPVINNDVADPRTASMATATGVVMSIAFATRCFARFHPLRLRLRCCCCCCCCCLALFNEGGNLRRRSELRRDDKHAANTGDELHHRLYARFKGDKVLFDSGDHNVDRELISWQSIRMMRQSDTSICSLRH